MAEYLSHRARRPGRAGVEELGTLLEIAPQIKAVDGTGRADQERDTPTPGLELGAGEQALHDQEHEAARTWPPMRVTYWNEL